MSPVLSVVPRPSRIAAAPGAPFRVTDGLGVVSDDPAIAALFIEDVQRDAGVALRASEDGAIRFELGLETTAVDPPEWLAPEGWSRADEEYRLVVSESGATVRASHAAGLFRGATTLRQLIAAGPSIDPVQIEDAPRHGWRGLSVDLGRTYLAPAELRELIDLLALYKLNVLHLHLTENAAWRLDIAGWPALVTAGEDAAAGWYIQADYTALVDYARDRFISVVPEVDIPGHTRAVVVAYPELGTLLPTGFAWLDTSPAALGFVDDVLGQLADLTPANYLHVGADEPFGMPNELYHEFLRKVLPLGRTHGKELIAWQEASRAGSTDLAAVQYWIDRDFPALMRSTSAHSYATPEMLDAVAHSFSAAPGDVARAVANGAKLILSPTAHAYLDLPYLEEATPEQRADNERLGYTLYPRTNVRFFLEWDQNEGLPAGTVGSGVEGAIWGETTHSLADTQFLVLPRLPGIAEHGWSPTEPVWDDYSARLAGHPALWKRRGWNSLEGAV